MRNEPVIMFEGPAAYAVKVGKGFEIVVYSRNSVNHRLAGSTNDPAQAKRLCDRLNAYPRQTRAFHGLQ